MARDFRGRPLVILTGAGISAESGLDTFRDPDGIWSRYDLRDVATPEGFEADPDLVHGFYNARRAESATAEPNPAHLALARLEGAWTGPFLLITQNIDRLHEAAGSEKLLHMHGELDKAWCTHCDSRHPWTGDLGRTSVCPACGAAGHMRPDIVWFGEVPYGMETIFEALSEAALFLAIGTSGWVYPAAGFVAEARRAGAFTVEINLQSSDEAESRFERRIEGKASLAVPAFVDELLAGATLEA
jgi:NAD-dependent deacetylase